MCKSLYPTNLCIHVLLRHDVKCDDFRDLLDYTRIRRYTYSPVALPCVGVLLIKPMQPCWMPKQPLHSLVVVFSLDKPRVPRPKPPFGNRRLRDSP